MIFEWDENKAESNLRNHQISFEEAEEVFYDEFSLDVFDDSHSDFDESRFNILGLAVKGVLLVVYTIRDKDSYRIISARKATKNESESYWKERKKYE